MINPIINPVWEALSSKQQHFNIGTEVVKYFPGNVAPFIALKTWSKKGLKELITQMPADRSVSVMIAKQVNLPTEMEVIFTTPLYQMCCPFLRPVKKPNIKCRKLTTADVPQMLELTEQTKPGPFYERTIEFGNYLGIFDKGKLVAMAGERLKLNGYTEVSAICTGEGYQGKGYASFLLAQVAAQIIAAGNIPFLHVKCDNSAAIAVYKKLGFTISADVYFAIFKKREGS